MDGAASLAPYPALQAPGDGRLARFRAALRDGGYRGEIAEDAAMRMPLETGPFEAGVFCYALMARRALQANSRVRLESWRMGAKIFGGASFGGDRLTFSNGILRLCTKGMDHG